MIILKLVLIAIIAYLIGSIPTGYLIVKKLKNIDIRTIGSGSTGATNVKRALGTKWFIIVMILDAIKGFLPTIIVATFFNSFLYAGLEPVVAATAVILGHCKPIFLNFAGGKSVATGMGTLIAICPPVGIICAVIWGVLTFLTKYVSFGSVVAAALSPLLMNAFSPNPYFIMYTAVFGVVIILTHKENIKRLVDGTENKIGK